MTSNTNQLTFTRFVAAISIVIYHFGNQTAPFNDKGIQVLISQASLGVSYFFILSGFVMVIAYGKRNQYINFGSYVKNRAARILPLYYLASAIVLVKVLYLLIIKGKNYFDFEGVLLNVLLLQSWFPGKALSINPAAWSLSTEAFFYVTFPFIFNKVYLRTRTWIIITAVVLLFMLEPEIFNLLNYLYHPKGKLNELIFHPITHITSFFIGNALGLIYNKREVTKNKNMFFPIIFLVALSIGILYILETAIDKNLRWTISIILFAPIIYAIACDEGWIATTFRKKPFTYLGEISYGIYILQFPVNTFFTLFLGLIHRQGNPNYFYIYLLVLVIVSGLSYQYVEIPLRNRIKNL